MGLRALNVRGEGIVCAEVAELLAGMLAQGGEALLLVPSLAATLAAQRELAAYPTLSMGVLCVTPDAWAEERWQLVGDGRRMVGSPERRVLMARVLEAAGDVAPMGSGAGTASLLCEVAQRGLAWLPADDEVAGLSAGEHRALEVLRAYAGELDRRGLVEPCQVMAQLPAALAGEGVRPLPTVAAGFADDLPRAVSELLAGLAERADVCVVRAEPSYDAGVPAAASAARGAVGGAGRAPELAEVLRCVSGDGSGASPEEAPSAAQAIARMGAVSLLEPAGPLAEAELTCREVARLVDVGARDVVVVASDATRTWGALAPKLAARGMAVRGRLSLGATQVAAASTFVRFARSVARLTELATAWPKPLETDEGKVPQLGDMSWWPPRDIVDFLLSDVSGVTPENAWARDAKWRGNRILTPMGVLATLQNASLTSPETARATVHLLHGHIGAAAGELLRALDAREASVAADEGPEGSTSAGDAAQTVISAPEGAPVSEGTSASEDGPAAPAPAASDLLLARAEAKAALGAVVSAAEALRTLGIASERPSRKGAKVELVSPTRLVDLLELALAGSNVLVRPRLVPAHTGDADVRMAPVDAADGRAARMGTLCAGKVLVLVPSAAAQLAPASADALVYLGLDAATSPVGNTDDARTALLAALGIEAAADPLARARRQLAAVFAVPRERLVLGRCANTADAGPTYPAVLLGELLDAYGRDERGRHLLAAGEGETLDEAPLSANLSPVGATPEVSAVPSPAQAGRLDEALRRFVVVPRDGQAELPDGRPSLSATQVETYLECPYKWFTLRRIGVDVVDAGFGGMEMGTFAHRVLELTHREVLRRALVAQGHELAGMDADEPWDGALPAGVSPQDAIPGSAVRAGNLEEAKQILREVFATHLNHQYREARDRGSQALIPHEERECLRLRELERDLLGALEFEATRLEGFEPRYFELRFGGKGAASVTYAGADLVGTIDRVDVDGHGRALVIDYKHKGRIFGDYALRPSGEVEEFSLPRHVQTLMYARILPQLLADQGLRVVGSLYFGTKGEPCLTGAVEENAVERLYEGAPSRSATRLTVPGPGVSSFEDLLDRTEERVAAAIQDMLAGRIDANPADRDACQWCPVTNCERRMS